MSFTLIFKKTGFHEDSDIEIAYTVTIFGYIETSLAVTNNEHI